MSSAAARFQPSHNDRDQLAIQQRLSRLNDARLRPRLNEAPLSLAEEMELRRLEASFLATEREAIADRAATAPSEPDAFLAWFEGLRDTGEIMTEIDVPFFFDGRHWGNLRMGFDSSVLLAK